MELLFFKTIQQSDNSLWEHYNRQPYENLNNLIEYKFEFDIANSLQAKNSRFLIQSICDIEFAHAEVSIETLTPSGYISQVLHFGKIHKLVPTKLETQFPPYTHFASGKNIYTTFEYLKINFIKLYDSNGLYYEKSNLHKASPCIPLEVMFLWKHINGVSYSVFALECQKLETYIWIKYHHPWLVKYKIARFNDDSFKRKYSFFVTAIYWLYIWKKKLLRKDDYLTFDKTE